MGDGESGYRMELIEVWMRVALSGEKSRNAKKLFFGGQVNKGSAEAQQQRCIGFGGPLLQGTAP